MAYVGTPIDTTNTFTSLQGKRFSGDASETAFTLDVAPASTLDIEVFVGNVRQDPNSAYTVSGTTLTFSAAPPTGTNNIYVVHQAKAVGTIDVPTGGVVAGSLGSSVLTGQTDIGGAIADADLFLIDDGAGGTLRKTAASRVKTYVGGFDVSSITGATALAEQPAATDEIVLSDAGTLKRLDITHIQNRPAFAATAHTATGIGSGSYTKVQLQTEVTDADSTYDNSSNYRFTPAVAGKYFIYGMVAIGSGTGVNNAERLFVALYKNGSKYQQTAHDGRNNAYGDTFFGTVNAIIDLDADDYVELYAKFHDGGSAGSNNYYTDSTTFGGFRITGL